MSERLKMILQTLGILLTAAVFGFLIWYFFFRAPSPTALPPTPTPTEPGQLPIAGEGGPGTVTPGGPGTFPIQVLPPLPSFAPGQQITTQILTANPAQNLAISGNTAAFYDPTTGLFSKVDANGNIVKLSDKAFLDVNKVTWAPGTDKAILEFPDQSKIIFNFATQTQVTLPKNWEDFTFSPDGGKIEGKSMGQDTESRWLFTANSDGSGQQAIQALGENADKVDVSWSPGNQIVAFSRTGSPRDGASQEVIPLGLHNENLKSLIVPGFGFQPKWAPDGNTLLYSVYNAASGYRPEIYVTTGGVDTLGQNRQPLKIQTWAEKCSFQSGTTLYCAVPTNLDEGVGLVPDAANNTSDAIMKIDLTTGLQQQIVAPGGETISSITASTDGKTLFYTDKQTGRLHKIGM